MRSAAEKAVLALTDLQFTFESDYNNGNNKSDHLTENEENSVLNSKITDDGNRKIQKKNGAENGKDDKGSNGKNGDAIEEDGSTSKCRKAAARVIIITQSSIDSVAENSENADKNSRKKDVCHFSDHGDITFAFSPVLVRVLQPTAVRTIKLKSFNDSVAHIKAIASEVRVDHARVCLYMCVSKGHMHVCI